MAAEGVVRRFGRTTALAGVDLTVPEGQVQALLGPNGAGKTTLVRVLSTLLRPDEGTAEVFGHDVVAEAGQVRELIGLTGQYAAVDELLTGRENLRMFGQLFHLPAPEAARRADELLERFQIAFAADRPVRTYSGGMRRRLDLASSLVTRPRLLFLDEPTTGLDPRSRKQMWGVIRELVAGGATLLLTTQYLEEADALADRIAVMDHGTILADGTGDELKEQVGGRMVEVLLGDPADRDKALRILHDQGCGEVDDPDEGDRTLRLPAPGGDGVALLADVARAMADAGVAVRDLGLRRPTLDDVFLELTGSHAGDAESDPAPTSGRREPS